MAEPYNIGVVVGADIDPLKKGLRDGSNEIQGFGAKAADATAKAAKGFAIFTGAVIGASTVLIALAKESSEAAREIVNLSKVSGVGAEQFQAHAYAARTLGVENAKLADIFKNTTERVGEFAATGSGPLKDFFENVAWRIGVTIDKFKDLSGPEALQLYYNSLEKANVSQKEMVFYLEQISSDSSNLIPLLKNGGQGFATLAKEAENAGAIISEMDLAILQENARHFDDMAVAAKGVSSELGVALNPAIEKLRDLTIQAAKGATDLIARLTDLANQTAAQAETEREVDEIIGRRIDRRGREISVASESARKINDLLREQAELQEKIDNPPKGGGRSGSATLQRYREQLPLLQAQVVENEKLIEQLKLESAEAQRIYDLRRGITEEIQTAATVAAESPALVGAPGAKGGGPDPGDEFSGFIKDPFEAADPLKQPLMDEFELGGDDPFATEQENFRNHWEEMNAIAVAGAGGVAQLISQNFGTAAGSTAAATKSMFESFSQNSRKMFEVNKAWGIADAIVSTAQGIAAGVKLGWPMGIPAVAWAVANGAAQISRIRSTQFGGGGGSAPTATSAPAAQQLPTTNNQGGDTGDRTLLIQGINPNSLYTGGQLENLAGSLEQFWNDGGGKGRVIFVKDQ